MNQLKLTISTPERKVLEEHIESVSLPTVDGEITILPHHVPLTTVLKAGELVIRSNNEVRPYAIGGGFAEIQPNGIVILADTAEHISDIDERRAEEAHERAKKIQTTMNRDHVEYAQLAAKLERDLARLRVVRKYRHQGHHKLTNNPS